MAMHPRSNINWNMVFGEMRCSNLEILSGSAELGEPTRERIQHWVDGGADSAAVARTKKETGDGCHDADGGLGTNLGQGCLEG